MAQKVCELLQSAAMKQTVTTAANCTFNLNVTDSVDQVLHLFFFLKRWVLLHPLVQSHQTRESLIHHSLNQPVGVSLIAHSDIQRRVSEHNFFLKCQIQTVKPKTL